MASVKEIEDEVREAAARGSTLDNIIPSVVRRAHVWLERNYTFAYMKQLMSVVLPEDARCMPLPPRVKEIYWLRTSPKATGKEDKLRYLVRVDPIEISSASLGIPSGWWLDSNEYIFFDAQPGEDVPLQMYFSRYTAYPSDNTEKTWLTDNAEELLIAQSMLHLAPFMRDETLVQFWQPRRDVELDAHYRREEELERGGTSMKMGYVPPGLRLNQN